MDLSYIKRHVGKIEVCDELTLSYAKIKYVKTNSKLDYRADMLDSENEKDEVPGFIIKTNIENKGKVEVLYGLNYWSETVFCLPSKENKKVPADLYTYGFDFQDFQRNTKKLRQTICSKLENSNFPETFKLALLKKYGT